MARGVNKAIIVDLYVGGRSIPQVSDAVGLSRSTVRYHLKRAGVLRSRVEGLRLAGKDGRISAKSKGSKRTFTAAWKRNLSAALRKAKANAAKGVSKKPSGYIEITTGPNKGKGEHRVIAENTIGRKLRVGEVVHHIDGNRANNDPENLQVMSLQEHASHHAKKNHKKRKRDERGRFI